MARTLTTGVDIFATIEEITDHLPGTRVIQTLLGASDIATPATQAYEIEEAKITLPINNNLKESMSLFRRTKRFVGGLLDFELTIEKSRVNHKWFGASLGMHRGADYVSPPAGGTANKMEIWKWQPAYFIVLYHNLSDITGVVDSEGLVTFAGTETADLAECLKWCFIQSYTCPKEPGEIAKETIIFKCESLDAYSNVTAITNTKYTPTSYP